MTHATCANGEGVARRSGRGRGPGLSRPHPVPPFHRRWIRATYADGIAVSALSVPRGSAKTYLAGMLAGLALRPGSPTYERGIEVLGVSASLEMSRVLLSFVREALRDCEDDYRWKDSKPAARGDPEGVWNQVADSVVVRPEGNGAGQLLNHLRG